MLHFATLSVSSSTTQQLPRAYQPHIELRLQQGSPISLIAHRYHTDFDTAVIPQDTPGPSSFEQRLQASRSEPQNLTRHTNIMAAATAYSAYDIQYFPSEAGTDCERHFEGHVKRCYCCNLTRNGASHKGLKCWTLQPQQHPSSNCDKHLQHVQDCQACQQREKEWEAGSSYAACIRGVLCAVLLCAVLAILVLVANEERRQRLFCLNRHTASIGNAIGPAFVAGSLTAIWFMTLLAFGSLERDAHSLSTRRSPQVFVIIIAMAFSVIIACVLPPWAYFIAPKFICGKEDIEGTAY